MVACFDFFLMFFIFITVRLVKWVVASLGLETQRAVVIWFVCFRSRFITVRLVKWVVASLGLVTRRTVVVTGRTVSSWWLDVMTPWSDWWTCHQDLYSEYSKATPGNAYVLLWITYWVSRIVCDRYQVVQFSICQFVIAEHIFRHLKLEIALSILQLHMNKK